MIMLIFIRKIIYVLKEDKRNEEDYVRNCLKTRLREEIQYLESKRRSELDAKAVFGDDMYQKMTDANEARNEALLSGISIFYIHKKW